MLYLTLKGFPICRAVKGSSKSSLIGVNMPKAHTPGNKSWGFNGAGATYDREALRASLKKSLGEISESVRGRPSLDQMGSASPEGHSVAFFGKHRIAKPLG
jgi:hypothetical protein